MSLLTIQEALLASLPPVSYDPAAPQLQRSTAISAIVLAEVEELIAQILLEQWPGNAVYTLEDWERVLGLPDCCSNTAQSLEQRQAAVLEKWLMKGGLSRQYFVSLYARRGVAVTVEDVTAHVWRITAPLTGVTYFRAGEGRAGDRLRRWGDAHMECQVNTLKPAHTRVQFAYV